MQGLEWEWEPTNQGDLELRQIRYADHGEIFCRVTLTGVVVDYMLQYTNKIWVGIP